MRECEYIQKHAIQDDNMQNSECGGESVNMKEKDGESDREKESDDSFHLLGSY